MQCQWCNHYRCRRFSQKFIGSLSYDTQDKHNRWYHGVDKRSVGIWASFFIMGLPISLFLFLLGVRYTRHLFGFNDSSLNPRSSSIDFGIRNELEMRVSMPPEVVLRVELPPSYEDCTKSNRLPSYEEALLMPNQ